MVRASAINRGQAKPTSYIVAVIFALVICVGIFIAVKGLFSSKKNSMSPSVSTSAPSEIFTEILKRTYPIFQPVQVPVGFHRTNIEIIDASKTKSKCEEILQTFSGSKNPDIAYIDMYLSAPGCSYPRPGDAQIFNIADYSGWISEPQNESTLIEITVKGSVVRIETDLLEREISGVMNEFEPITTTPPKDSIKVHISD